MYDYSSSPPPAAPLARLKIWGFCLVTTALTIALLQTTKQTTGLNLIGFTMWVFVPVGALVVAALALTGFWGAANRYQWLPDTADLLFLMTLCVLLQVVPVALDYWTVLHFRPDLDGHLSFGTFFSHSLKSATYVINSSQHPNAPPQAMGDAGLVMLLPRMGCLLAMAKIVHSSCGRE